MHLLRILHRYLGLVLTLPVLALALSGAALVYKESIWHLQYPQLTDPPPRLTASDHARAMTGIMRRHPDQVRFIKWPQPELAAYQLWFKDGSRAFLDPVTLEPIARWHWHESVVGILEAVHFSLLLGDAGETLAGYAGLAAVLMGLSGLVLWWPARRRPLLRGLWPARLHRGLLIRSHRNWGVIAAPLLLIIVTTGTGVAFYGPLSNTLSALFNTASPEVQPADVPVRGPAVQAAIANARQRFPDSRITFFYPHSRQTPLLKVRLRQPAELHPNGSTFVHADPRTGEVLKVRDAVAAPATQKALNSLYPIHAAKLDYFFIKPASVFTSLFLAFIVISGVLAYYRYIRPAGARRSRTEERPRALRQPVQYGETTESAE